MQAKIKALFSQTTPIFENSCLGPLNWNPITGWHPYVCPEFRLFRYGNPTLPSTQRKACLSPRPVRRLIGLSQTLFGNPKGPVELGYPNTCAETKLCLNFILFRLKK